VTAFGAATNLELGAIGGGTTTIQSTNIQVRGGNSETFDNSSGTSPPINIRSGNPTANGASSAATNIYTGGDSSTNNSTGNVNIYTSTPTGAGTRGSVNIQTTAGNTIIGIATGTLAIDSTGFSLNTSGDADFGGDVTIDGT